MAQFPFGGFFNRNRQNVHHSGQFQHMPGYGMGNMQPNMPMHGFAPRFGPGMGPVNQNFHPQQNVPRGTFPQNFGPNFGSRPQNNPNQGGANRGRPPYAPANMQAAMPRGQMPMPQANQPAQQMPPMHLLNPTNDPNVRFEPMADGMMPQGGAPRHGQAPPGNPAESNPNQIISRLSDYVQGESNSLVYYENLSKSPQISQEDKEVVLELMSNKKQHMQNAAKLFRDLTKSEWNAADMKIAGTKNFKADIAYALLQESRLLREASFIYQNLDNEAHQKAMGVLLYNKVADIAHLMSL